MEVAVQKDCVRNQLSANLQQRSAGCCCRNTQQSEMLSSWGSEARALSRELLLQPVCLVQIPLLSLLYSQIRIAHQTYMSHILGWRLFLPKLFTKLCVLADIQGTA